VSVTSKPKFPVHSLHPNVVAVKRYLGGASTPRWPILPPVDGIASLNGPVDLINDLLSPLSVLCRLPCIIRVVPVRRFFVHRRVRLFLLLEPIRLEMFISGFPPALMFYMVWLTAMSTIRTITARCPTNPFAIITVTISVRTVGFDIITVGFAVITVALPVRLLVGTFVRPMPLLVAYEAYSLECYERDLSLVVRLLLFSTSHRTPLHVHSSKEMVQLQVISMPELLRS
jgi:hypothetical protein